MNPNRPLAYESFKCVLQYMPADLRLLLAHQCLSVRATDMLFPLKFDILDLNPLELRVNNNVYQVKILKGTNNTSELISEDPYGLQTFAARQDVVVPGEVSIPYPTPRDPIFPGIQAQADKIIAEVETTGDPKMYLENHFKKGTFSNDMVKYLVYKRFNLPLPFKLYIQLMVFSAKGNRVERVLYDPKTGFDAMKYLYFKFFNERSGVRASSLKITLYGPMRFPSSFKIDVPKLRIAWNHRHDITPIENLVDFSKLQSISIYGIGPYSHPLILRVPLMTHSERLLDDPSFFHHRNIFFDGRENEKKKITEFIVSWSIDGKPVETLYSFRIYQTLEVPAWFEEWKQFEGAEVAEQSGLVRIKGERKGIRYKWRICDLAENVMYAEFTQPVNTGFANNAYTRPYAQPQIPHSYRTPMNPSNLPQRLIMPMNETSTIHIYCIQESNYAWILNLEVCRIE